jgi:hypothetical protein
MERFRWQEHAAFRDHERLCASSSVKPIQATMPKRCDALLGYGDTWSLRCALFASIPV